MCDPQVLSDRSYLWYFLASIFAFTVYLMPNLHMPSLMASMKIPPAEVSMAVSILGIATGCGRLMCGAATNFSHHVVKINLIVNVCCAGATFLYPHCTKASHFYVVTAINGLCLGPLITLAPVTMVHLLGVDLLGTAYGLWQMMYGILLLAGPPFIGALIDYCQEYTVPFYVAAVFFLLAAFFQALCEWRTSNRYT